MDKEKQTESLASKRRAPRVRRRPYPWQRRRRRAFVCFVLVPAVVLGAYTVWRIRLERAVAAQIEGIRARGYPVSLEELEAWYPRIPDEENAWTSYRAAFDAWQGLPAERFESLLPRKLTPPERDEPYPESALAVMREYVGMNAETLRLLHEAAAVPRCRFPVDLSEGWEARLPHLESIRKAEQLLRFEAEVALNAGDTGRIVRALADLLALGRSLGAEPVFTSQEVRINSIDTVRHSLERVLSRVSLSEAALVELEVAIAAAACPEAALRTVLGEFCVGIPQFSDGTYPRVNATALYRQLLRGGGQAGPWLLDALSGGRIDLGYFLEVYDGTLEAAGLPRHEGMQALRNLQHGRRKGNPRRWAVRTYGLTWRVMGVLDRAARGEAALRTVRTGLAIERYHAKTGGWPGVLNDLTPAFLDAVPVDPYNGEALLYHSLETGYVVYSVATNGRDDGGEELPGNTQSWRQSDLAFKVER